MVAVEPNIFDHGSLCLMNEEDAIKKASLFVLLVKHKEFVALIGSGSFEKLLVLDFCGILAQGKQ